MKASLTESRLCQATAILLQGDSHRFEVASHIFVEVMFRVLINSVLNDEYPVK
jgi:hypothetical protein